MGRMSTLLIQNALLAVSAILPVGFRLLGVTYFIVVLRNLHDTNLFQNNKFALLIVLRTSFASSSFDLRNISPLASMFHSTNVPDSLWASNT